MVDQETWFRPDRVEAERRRDRRTRGPGWKRFLRRLRQVRRRTWIGGTVAVLVVVTAAGWPLFVQPAASSQASAADPADAVLALGGKTETATYALELVREGKAKHAVLSNPYGPWVPEMVRMCPADPPADRTCFVPDPETTRGEAREIAELAAQNDWDDVIVVTPTYHITRSKYIVSRCYHGRLRMVDPHLHTMPWEWPYQYVYQTVGFVKAFAQRGC